MCANYSKLSIVLAAVKYNIAILPFVIPTAGVKQSDKVFGVVFANTHDPV